MKIIKYILLLAFGFFAQACNNSNKKTEVTTENKQETLVAEKSIISKEVSYATDSVNMSGYISYDAAIAQKKPGILVIHEWWGHNEYVRERADMLADLGYVALAVDMYGDGKTADHPDDAGKFAGMVFSNIDEAKARFESALETLKANPHVDQDKIAAVGYCFGGSVALCMANAGYDLDAVAAFHSGVNLPIEPSKEIKGKVLVANGADDPFITAEDAENYKAKMDAVGADYEYISYEGAKHAYTSKGADELGVKFELPLEYNKEADEASWKKLNELLAAAFAK